MNSRAANDIHHSVRRLLREQYHILLNSEPGALVGRIEPLHDMRVAIRRLRNLLKAFRKALLRPDIDAFEARFQQLSKRLGPSRDMDVWMRVLKSVRVIRSGEWLDYVGRQHEIQKKKKESLRRILADPSYHSLKADFDQFLNRLTVEITGVTLAKLGARAVQKSIDRMVDRSRLGSSFSARRVHLLRIACRQARYMAEFCAATRGQPGRPACPAVESGTGCAGRHPRLRHLPRAGAARACFAVQRGVGSTQCRRGPLRVIFSVRMVVFNAPRI